MTLTQSRPPLALIILDGWGIRESTDHNAIAMARTPVWDQLWQEQPHALLEAHGPAVGLPEGQMGNSRVGHLTMGAGRVTKQHLSQINESIETGELFHNDVLLAAIDRAVANQSRVHLIGLLSPGGVHSHQRHLMAVMELACSRGAIGVDVHGILDGRDMPPRSAQDSIVAMEERCQAFSQARLTTLCGRYYAMDRDNRWDRIERAYRLYFEGQAERVVDSGQEGLAQAYAQEENDEFVKPTIIRSRQGETPAPIGPQDTVIFMNFRADRMRQIVKAFVSPNFDEFSREQVMPKGSVVCLTEYDAGLNLPIIVLEDPIEQGLGEWLSISGFSQMRLAETEKYAHVTYYFNGGREQPWPNEQRVLIDSPKVATYDLKPEMSAYPVTEVLLRAINTRQVDVIICNYANADMVGHTGHLAAATKAVEVLDHCLGQVVTAINQVGGQLLVTADHGNIEHMHDHDHNQAHTAHTLNPVPLVYVGPKSIKLSAGGLSNIAPTVLDLLDLPPSETMTASSCVERVS